MWETILQYCIPAILVGAVAYALIDRLLRNDEYRRNFELKKQLQSTITPVKLRAYERLAIFLERITPTAMIAAKLEPNMTAIQLQTLLLNEIRREFEHNYSQQLYVAADVWEAVRNANLNTVQLINLSAAQCQPNDPAVNLAQVIIKAYTGVNETAIDAAMQALKDEMGKIVGR